MTKPKKNLENVESFEKNSKVYSLEKNLEQLSLMYQMVSTKYSGSRTDITIYEKKLSRKQDRIVQLEKNLKKTTDQLNTFKYKLENIESEPLNSNPSRSQHSKIKKMIKGGGNPRVLSLFCPYSLNTE